MPNNSINPRDRSRSTSKDRADRKTSRSRPDDQTSNAEPSEEGTQKNILLEILRKNMEKQKQLQESTKWAEEELDRLNKQNLPIQGQSEDDNLLDIAAGGQPIIEAMDTQPFIQPPPRRTSRRLAIPTPDDRKIPQVSFTLTNRFSSLVDTTPEEPTNSAVPRPGRENQTRPKQNQNRSQSYIPPIKAPKTPDELRLFADTVKSVCSTQPRIRFFPDGSAKVHTSTDGDLNAVKLLLIKNKVPHFSHALPGTQPKKLVVKAAPFFEADEVLGLISEFSPHVTAVHKLRAGPQRTSSSFLCEFNRDQNLGEIREVKSLGGIAVSWQTYHRLGAAQCHNCLQFGHGSSYCYLDPKCMKCAGGHNTHECEENLTSEQFKCANCGGAHAANFRECPKYPQKRTEARTQPNQARVLPPATPVTNQVSYSTMLRGPLQTPVVTQFQSQANPTSAPRAQLQPSTNQANATSDFLELVSEVQTLQSLVDIRQILADLRALIQAIRANPNTPAIVHFLQLFNGK